MGVALGRRPTSSATVWCVSQPRHRTSRYKRNRRLGRRQVSETACTHACVDSKPRTPAGRLPCALPWRARRELGWKSRKCFRVIWCPWRQNALRGSASASRYRLRWINGFGPKGGSAIKGRAIVSQVEIGAIYPLAYRTNRLGQPTRVPLI
jgi:hypothetical protein